jgi:hypothetical protein
VSAADFGQTSYATDAREAVAYAKRVIAQTSSARAWSAAWTAYATTLAEKAFDYARKQWTSARVFWETLTKWWMDASGKGGSGVDGWDKVGRAFAAIAGLSYAVITTASKANPLYVAAAGTVETGLEIADDAAGALDFWGKHGKKVMIAGGVVVVAWLWSR